MDYKFINPAYLDSVAGDAPQVIAEIVTMFKEQASDIYTEMKALNSANDYITLGMVAHKAKSSVAIIGMSELAAILKTLELNAKDGRESELYDSYIEKFGEDTRMAFTELDDLVSNRLKEI